MDNQPIWLTEADVVASMNLPQAIKALESGLRLQAEGKAQTMGKTHASWDGGNTLHAVGATFQGAGFIGTKTWAHTTGGATPLLIMWDSNSGKLAAIIEAFALGQMRTGGVSGVGTSWLAAPNASTFAIIGTGKQALAQVASVAAVRKLDQIRVFSPTQEKREAFAVKVADLGLDANITVANSAEEAVDHADIVTLATRAREPILTADMVAKGTHINAIGAITPERTELCQSVFERTDAIVADDPAATRKLSAEFRTYLKDDDAAWGKVRPLSEIISAGQPRAEGADLSVFKAMGMGLSDLSLGIRIIEHARQNDLGRAIPHPTRVAPRLTA